MVLHFSFSPASPEESNKKHPFPCPTSYRTALTYYLDITNPPRTNVLYELAQYATNSGEQERLRKMASSAAEGKVGALPFPSQLGAGGSPKGTQRAEGVFVWGGCDGCALLACRHCTSAGWWRPAGTSWPSCRTCPPCAPPSTTCVSSCPACRPATTPLPPPPRWVCFQQGVWLWSWTWGASPGDICYERGRFSDLCMELSQFPTASVESPTLQPGVS